MEVYYRNLMYDLDHPDAPMRPWTGYRLKLGLTKCNLKFTLSKVRQSEETLHAPHLSAHPV